MSRLAPAPRVVLASTSRYRRALMDRLQFPYDAVAPDCDETRFPHLGPDALAVTLAEDKARSVHAPGALVIGSDQVVDLDGDVLGKPHTAERAAAQLARLAGRSHRLVTAVCVRDTRTEQIRTAVDVHVMTMRPLSQADIARYIAADAPLDCAGSYVLERLGIALFERVEADPETADDTAIIGLPVMKTLALLRSFGFDPLAAASPVEVG